MPYLQGPAVNNPFGLQPVQMTEAGGTLTPYTVSTSFGSAILPGDAVVMTSSAGFLTLYTSGATPVGVAAESIPASLSSARRCLVYADPDQTFVVQLSTAQAAAGIGGNIGITTTSTQVLSTPIRSRMMAGVVAPVFGNAAVSTGALRIMGIHPIEGIDGSTGLPANTKLIVKFNLHSYGNQLTT